MDFAPLDGIGALDLGAANLRIATGPTAADVRLIENYLLKTPHVRIVEPSSDPYEAIHLEVSESPCGVTGRFAFGALARQNGGHPVEAHGNKLHAEWVRYAAVTGLFCMAAQIAERHTLLPSLGIETLLPLQDYRESGENEGRERKAFGAQFKGLYRGRFVPSANARWGQLGEFAFRVVRSLVGCEGAPVVAIVPVPVPNIRWRAVADLGASTMDLPVFRLSGDGDWELDNGASDGTEIPLNDAMEQLTRDVNREYGRKFSRADVAGYLAQGGDIPNGIGQPISILTLAARHLGPVADSVAATLISVWQSRSELTGFELIGGGAAVLKEFIRGALDDHFAVKKGGSVPFALYDVPDARTINAQAAYAQARRRFR